MTLKYAVIGNPIAHSKSPVIHAAFAEQMGIALTYERVLAPLDAFNETVQQLMLDGYNGANVTVPFKFAAFALCDVLSVQAQAAKAVNTLTFKQGQMFGDNTDGVGLLHDITHNLNVALAGKRVLLMGAGGAAYGVVLPLLHAGVRLTVANRTAEKAIALAKAFNAPGQHATIRAGSYKDFQNEPFDVLINATSTGLTHDLPPIREHNFAENALAYEMMYGRVTQFTALANSALLRGKHVKVADGLGMLVEQAAEAFWIWHRKRPYTAPVIDSLR